MIYFNSKKLNMETVIKQLILFGFAIFFYFTIHSGKAQLYVHPRIVPYMKIGIVVFVAIALFMSGDLFKPQRRKVSYVPYLFFIIPLMMAFALPPKAMDASSLSIKDIRVSKQSNAVMQKNGAGDLDIAIDSGNNTIKSNSASGSSNTSNLDSSLYKKSKAPALEGDMIVINESNFIAWVQELYDHQDQYEGKKVQITGFVFRNKDFNDNEFVAARLMMSCCTADLQPVGLLCQYKNASTMKNEDWFKISGVIKKAQYQGQLMPLVQVQNAEKVEKPKDEYVYQ